MNKKLYQLIKALLSTNNFPITNKRLKLEIVNDPNQVDGINIKYSLYNCAKNIYSKQTQEFIKNAYYKALESKKFDIPWKIEIMLSLPKYQIDETILEDSSKITAVINDLKTKIIKEGITITNNNTQFAVNLSATELFQNFDIENHFISELINNCAKTENNFEVIKKESNFVANIENQTSNYHCRQLSK